MPHPETACCLNCKWEARTALDPFEGSAFPLALCPRCGRRGLALVFPAARRGAGGGGAGVAAAAGDAVCFHHPAKRAEVACEACGRFLCELCHVDLDGRALCAACLAQMHTHSDKTRGAGNATSAHVPSRIRYDQIALWCALCAPALSIISFVPAGVALYLCIRHWRTPLSALPRNRWRFVVAGLGAVAVLAGWLAMAGFMVYGVWSARPKGEARMSEEYPTQEVTHGDE
ncbi:MAG: hypothetical protein FWG50_04505 [Kiritimatiellaeota bacterium]|nr:hypothetical protein [Kiritimatiellota bacterium]